MSLSLQQVFTRVKLRLSNLRPPQHSRMVWLMAGLVLIGFFLRTYHLDAKDIWVDEANPWYFATLPLLVSIRAGFSGGAINSTADPTYNILLHYWIELTGSTLYGLRYLSVILNLLGAAYLGRVAARGFGWRAGLAALAVGMIAPVWIFFSQEMRPYAFTPALMLVMVEAAIRIAKTGGRKPWPWVMLAVGEALAVYTHGFMIVAVFAINLWIAVLWLRLDRKWLFLRDWVISQVGAVAALGPVLALLVARSSGIHNPFTVALDPASFASMLWSYLMGVPWENVFDPIALRLWAALALISAGLALAIGLRRAGKRLLADLTWLVLGLSLLMFIYDQRDPSFVPRYAVFITGPLFVVLGVLAAMGWEAASRARWLSWLLALTLLIDAGASIGGLYAGSLVGFRHPSTLAVSKALKGDFGAQDGVVVVAPHDFTVNYYGHGDAPLVFSRFDEGIEKPADILAFAQGKNRIGVLRNNNEHSDSRRILPFYLARYGALTRRQIFEGYDLSTYRLDPAAAIQMASFQPTNFNFGDLQLTGTSIASGGSVTVALRWATPAGLQLTHRYVAAIRLTDTTTNWDLGESDMLLYSDSGLPTDWWTPGQGTTQYFVIPLLPGTPPIDADLFVTVYDQATGKPLDLRDAAGAPAGQQAHLGSVKLGPAPDSWAYDEDQRPWRLTPVDSPVISGALVDQPSVAPGASLGVTLAWSAAPDSPDVQQSRIQLERNGVILGQAAGPPLEGRPAAQVEPGKTWLDRRLVRLAMDATTGPADLVVVVGSRQIRLASVDVSGVPRQMTPPEVQTPFEAVFGGSMKLIGFQIDAPSPLTSAATIQLTLYWQALADGAPNANYKVFAHILAADGHLVGQHDGVPAGETRPFSGWLSGEYVTDEHPMVFTEPYTGSIQVQVGLYDAVTLQRVPTADGSDSVLLPVKLQVEAKP